MGLACIVGEFEVFPFETGPQHFQAGTLETGTVCKTM